MDLYTREARREIGLIQFEAEGGNTYRATTDYGNIYVAQHPTGWFASIEHIDDSQVIAKGLENKREAQIAGINYLVEEIASYQRGEDAYLKRVAEEEAEMFQVRVVVVDANGVEQSNVFVTETNFEEAHELIELMTVAVEHRERS